jgi:hypothetical protein
MLFRLPNSDSPTTADAGDAEMANPVADITRTAKATRSRQRARPRTGQARPIASISS